MAGMASGFIGGLQLPAPARRRGVRRGTTTTTMHASGKFFVGGNWKCNGTTESVNKLVKDLNDGAAKIPADKVEVVVTPPFIFLDQVASQLKAPYQLGAQNAWIGRGAFTGEVSAEMLQDRKIPWVVLGHSERRTLCGESNEAVGKKCAHALEKGMSVIACVGETLDQRYRNQIFDVLDAQLTPIAAAVSANWEKVVVAYEPVWAIGTGVVATPEQAEEVHSYLRNWLNTNVSKKVGYTTRLLYGGSVNAKNCAALAEKENIDGFLVGGAALIGADFVTICTAVPAAGMAPPWPEEDYLNAKLGSIKSAAEVENAVKKKEEATLAAQKTPEEKAAEREKSAAAKA